MRRSVLTVCFTLLLLGIHGVCPDNVYGQTGQGTLTGTVTDTTGAVIAGVSVVIRNQSNGFVYNAVTTQEGIYRVPYLNVGTYEITFSASGFKKVVRRDIPIRSSETLGLDATMEIGMKYQTSEIRIAAL